MRAYAKGAARAFAAFVLLVVSFPSITAPPATPSDIWGAVHKTLLRIDPASNGSSATVDVPDEVEGLAIDPRDGGVWALSHKRLGKFDRAGQSLLDINLKDIEPKFDKAEAIVLNPYDGAVWIAGKKQLVYLDESGTKRLSWSAPDKIDAIAFDIDESLWVLTQQALLHLAEDGRILSTLDLTPHVKGPKRVVVDGLSGLLWIMGEKALLRFDTNRLDQPPLHIALPKNQDEVEAAAGHPVFGTLWLAVKDTLLLYDRSGTLIKQVDLKPHGLGDVEAMTFEPVSASLWLAGKKSIMRLAGNGDYVTRIDMQKEIEAVAAGPFTLAPSITLLVPPDNALTNKPAPRLEYELGAHCSGSPCLLVDSYIDSLNLAIDLNGQPVGPLFSRSGARAFYDPTTRLPEGINTLKATATDVFGHASPEIISRFTIDTIPPRFNALSPADGSVLSQPAVTITGSVDDPTANVLLADANGQGISMGGANFSFAVALRNGLNTFRLTARDPAGNETTVPLRLTLAGGVSVTIESPTQSASLNSTHVIVRGSYSGPANTGVTVNGTPAALLGNAFYANLVLQPGQNTILARAATSTGGTATHSINVVVPVTPQDDIQVTVDPQSGIAPHAVRFSVSSTAPQPPTRVDVDFDGNGTIDFTTADPAVPITHSYVVAGVYLANVIVVDHLGASRSRSTAIVVSSFEAVDGMLRGIYNGMMDNLRTRNIDGALTAISGGMREKYRTIFEALGSSLPTVVDQLGTLQTGTIGGAMAEYVVVRQQNGTSRAFLIYLLKGEDGVWRIDGM